MTLLDLIAQLGPSCADDERRAAIVDHPTLNAIDFVEYALDASNRHLLVVHFLKSLPDGSNSGPDGAYGLVDDAQQIRIEGGRRIVGIEQRPPASVIDGSLVIELDAAGDFSDYWLALGWQRQASGRWKHGIANLDPRLSIARVDFKAACPSAFDCDHDLDCVPEDDEAPTLDYLAKDYASFRRLMLDLAARSNPRWRERSPADVGVALVELLAYAGDHLSYYQDAVANEAYLETARQRVSAKRHARLVDYAMHDGCNAWTHVHVRAGSNGSIAAGTKFITHIGEPLPGASTLPDCVIEEADLPDDWAAAADGALSVWETHRGLRRARVFESSASLEVYPHHNEIAIHTWGNLECCLPVGTRSAYLYCAANPNALVAPTLAVGDYLLLEEIKGRRTGAAADADPSRRWVVRLEWVEATTDPVYADALDQGKLAVRTTGDPALPLLYVEWSTAEALPWPLFVSMRTAADQLHTGISVARGNMVLVDHGRTVRERSEAIVLSDHLHPRLRLSTGPVSQVAASTRAPRDAIAAVMVSSTTPVETVAWLAVPHLLDSSETDPHFVVDVDHDGRTQLRFGDGVYGRSPRGADGFEVCYRVGNGSSGNVGADAIVHVVQPDVAPLWPTIEAVRNPLVSVDGVDPETIEEVRTAAPAAFRQQRRAVTTGDYVRVALEHPEVAGAVAAFRWTGSWNAVVVGVDPTHDEALVRLPDGRLRLDDDFAERVRAHVDGYRLAGYDVFVRAGVYVPLDIRLRLCVSAQHFRADVIERVYDRLSADRSSGYFHCDHWSFGTEVYLSGLLAAVQAVDGVESVIAERFQRFGKPAAGELEAAMIEIGSWEIAELRNDPNFREAGVLNIDARGGK